MEAGEAPNEIVMRTRTSNNAHAPLAQSSSTPTTPDPALDAGTLHK
jgi:hypothetical protein